MCAAAPTTDKLQQTWKDFPKGLHVLVAIANAGEREEVTGILESCSYRVTAFTSEDDALAALESDNTPFHAAMVDATNRDVFDGFKVLEAAKDLAVIMISSTEDIDTMMRAISLGAADFLQRPFSEEKLKNIWQHVARKMMLGNEQSVHSKTFVKSEPVDDEAHETQSSLGDFGYIMSEPFDCMRFEQPDVVKLEHPEENFEHGEEVATFEHPEEVQPQAGDKLHDDFGLEFCTADETCIKLEIDDTLDDLNLGDGIVLDGEGGSDFKLDPSIFVGLPDSDSDSALDMNFEVLDSGDTHDSELDGEDPLALAHVFKTEDQLTCNVSESSESVSISSCSTKDKGEEETKPDRTFKGSKSAPGRKKMKVDWTPELHQKFVQAVEQLGVDKAIPSRILEHMGVQCLTRHNVASHLQKYRSHRKHLLQREAEAAANWSHRRHSDSWKNRTPIQTRQPPILPAPPPGGVPLLVWGHPTIDHSSAHLWQQPPLAPPPWQAPDGTLWQHPAACFPPWGHAPAAGTPVYPTCMRVPVAPLIAAPQHPIVPLAPLEAIAPPACHPPREVVDAVISEALTNPCTLPLGLKPPSMESVMSELVKQGISITPPTPS